MSLPRLIGLPLAQQENAKAIALHPALVPATGASSGLHSQN